VVERFEQRLGIGVDRRVEPDVPADQWLPTGHPGRHMSGRTTIDSSRPGPTPITEMGTDVIASIAST
jgi:hypothetical protein